MDWSGGGDQRTFTFPDAGSGEVVVTIAAWKTLVSHPVTFSYPPATAAK
jgi:hypothetical protein